MLPILIQWLNDSIKDPVLMVFLLHYPQCATLVFGLIPAWFQDGCCGSRCHTHHLFNI